MKKIFLLTVFGIFLFSQLSPAIAGYITIETKTATSIQGNILKISIEAKNNGNESAYNVEISTSVQDEAKSGKVKDILGVGETHRADLDFSLNLQNPGRYAAIIYVNYTDANQYPFSAISCLQFNYGENVSSQVFAKSVDVTMSEMGEFELNVKNLADTDKDVEIKLIIPKELSADKSLQKINLKARSEAKTSFRINNFSALAGSNYQVYSILEYNKSGKHYLTVVPGVIRIAKEEPFYQKYKIAIIAIAVMLIVLFLIFQFKPKMK